MEGVIQLADVKSLPRDVGSLIWHYDNLIMQILEGKVTLSEVLANMRVDFDKYMARFPQEEDELARIYVSMERRARRYDRERSI